MNYQRIQLLKNMLTNLSTDLEILYYHMNMNSFVSHAIIRLIKIKRKLSKTSKKNMNFINRIKEAKHKIFCNCVDVYKICDGNGFDKIYDVLSELKNKKLEINILVIEKYKKKNEHPDFEQNYYSKTTQGPYKVSHFSIKLRKWLDQYDRSFFEKINYFDLMGSILTCLDEISEW